MSMGSRRARCAPLLASLVLVLGFVTCSGETAARDDTDLSQENGAGRTLETEVSAELVLKDLMLWMRDNRDVAPLLEPENSSWLETFLPQGSSGEQTVALSFAMREALSREIEKAASLLPGNRKDGDGATAQNTNSSAGQGGGLIPPASDAIDAGDDDALRGAELTRLSEELEDARRVLSSVRAEADAKQRALGETLRERNAQYDEVKALYQDALLSLEERKEDNKEEKKEEAKARGSTGASPAPPPAPSEHWRDSERESSRGGIREEPESDVEDAEDDYGEMPDESDIDTIPDGGTIPDSEATVPEETVPAGDETDDYETTSDDSETLPAAGTMDDVETAETGPPAFPPLATDETADDGGDGAAGKRSAVKSAVTRLSRIIAKLFAVTYSMFEWFMIKLMSSSLGLRLSLALDSSAMTLKSFAATFDSWIGTSLASAGTARFRSYVEFGVAVTAVTALLTVRWVGIVWYRWTFKQRVPTSHTGKPKPVSANAASLGGSASAQTDASALVVNTAFPAPTTLRHRTQEQTGNFNQVPQQQVPAQWHPTPIGAPNSVPSHPVSPAQQAQRAFNPYADNGAHSGFHGAAHHTPSHVQPPPTMRRGPPPRVNPVYKHE
jgi:hypothetical protein